MNSHRTPRFDISGQEIRSETAFPSGANIKYWESARKGRTEKEVLEERKKEEIPDPSYDLDGDGFISNVDLVISKLYDKDKDGKLNAEERKAALEAVKQGVVDTRIWGLENVGPNPALRTIQKRGKIIEHDCTEEILNTYPVENEQLKEISTRTELVAKRKAEVQKIVEERIKQEPPFRTTTEWMRSEWQVANPRFKTARKLKRSYKPHSSNKKQVKIPSIEYVDIPNYKTCRDLYESRKKQDLADLGAKANYNRPLPGERVNLRDEALMLQSANSERMTWRKKQEMDRREMHEHNIKLFSNESIGVHGKELPKFASNQPEYWRNLPEYRPEPPYPSQILLKISQKHWAKPEEFLAYDFSSTHRPFEKEMNRLSKVSSEPVLKPGQVNPFTGFDPHEEKIEWVKKPSKKQYRESFMFGEYIEKAAELGINMDMKTEFRNKTVSRENAIESREGLPAPSVNENIATPIEMKKPSTAMILSKKVERTAIMKVRTCGFN